MSNRKLKTAMKEIRMVLEKHDIAGIALLSNKKRYGSTT